MADVEKLAAEFRAFKQRVEPVIEAYEAHLAAGGQPAALPPVHPMHAAAAHLEAGRLDDAGRTIALVRAHAGEEDDRSFARRLITAIHGPEEADRRVPLTEEEPADGDLVADVMAKGPETPAPAAEPKEPDALDPPAEQPPAPEGVEATEVDLEAPADPQDPNVANQQPVAEDPHQQ